MKTHIFLTLLGGLLLSSALPAQNTRAKQLQSLSEAARNLPQTLTAGGSSQLRLDSTVLFQFFLADSFPNQKREFTYPAPEVNIATDFRMFDNWAPEVRTTTFTDEQGRIVTALGEVWDADEQKWQAESLLEAFPHQNSLTENDSFFIFTWDPDLDDWTPALSVINVFNAQSRLLASITNFSLDIFGETSIRDEFFYDSQGNNYLTIQSLLQVNTWQKFARIEKTFVQNREIEATTSYYMDETSYAPGSRLEQEYDAEGNLIATVYFEYDYYTSEWQLWETNDYDLDNSGRIVSHTNENLDPEFPTRTRIDYAYLSGNDLHSETQHNWDYDTGQWMLLDKTYYYYSNTTSAPSIPKPEPLAISPNPTAGPVFIEAGPDALLSILNIQGTSMQAIRLDANRFDLSNLPAGLYYIQVREGNQIRQGAVVRQ